MNRYHKYLVLLIAIGSLAAAVSFGQVEHPNIDFINASIDKDGTEHPATGVIRKAGSTIQCMYPMNPSPGPPPNNLEGCLVKMPGYDGEVLRNEKKRLGCL